MFSRRLILNVALVGLACVGSLFAIDVRLPRPLADVRIDVPGGTRVRLTSTKSKARVIALVAAACDHCVEVTAALSKVERQFRARGVQVIGAVVDENAASAYPEFIAKTRPSFTMGTLSPDNTRRLADFGMRDKPFVPIVLFVDSSNLVRYQFFGDEGFFANNVEKNLANMVETMLKLK